MVMNRDAELLERGAVSDARQQKHLWRADCSAGQDHLAPRFDAPCRAAEQDIDARRAVVLDDDAGDQRVSYHRHVRAIDCRLQECSDPGFATPGTNGPLARAVTFRVGAIEVVAVPELQRAHCVCKNRIERIGVSDAVDVHRPAPAMIG